MADIISDKEILERFEKRVGKLLEQFQSSKVLDARSRRHQRELENLLERTNKILSNEATKTEVNGFDELLDSTEKSFKQLKENHKDDKKFQKEFNKAFGEEKRAGTIAKEISEKMSASISDVVNSVKVINKQEVDRSMSTALQAATGPLGQIFKDTIDISGLKEAFSKKQERPQPSFGQSSSPSILPVQELNQDKEKSTKPNIVNNFYNEPDSRKRDKSGRFVGSSEANAQRARRREPQQYNPKGMFHEGVKSVPQEGSYILDRNERVVSPEQNEDLTEFLNKVSRLSTQDQSQTSSDQLVRVLTHDSSRSYFEPLIEHRDAIFNKEQKTRRQYHSEEMLQMSSIRSAIAEESQNSILAVFRSIGLFYKRFERHPILNTLDLLFKAVKGLPKALKGGFKFVWQSVFGRDLSAEEQTAENTRRIYERMTTGQESGRNQTRLQRLTRWINTFGGATTRKAQKAQTKQEQGEKLSFFERAALKRQGKFVTKGLGQEQTRESRFDNSFVTKGVAQDRARESRFDNKAVTQDSSFTAKLPGKYPSDRSARAKAMPRDSKGRFKSREDYERQDVRDEKLGLFEKMEEHQYKILEILDDDSGSGGSGNILSGLGTRIAALGASIAALAKWKVTLPAAIGAAVGTGINHFWQTNAPDSYRTASDLVGFTVDSVRAAVGNEDAQRRIDQNETANSIFQTMDSISGFMDMKWDSIKAAYGDEEARERLIENPGYLPDTSQAVGRYIKEERKRRRQERSQTPHNRSEERFLHSILMGEDIATQAINREIRSNTQNGDAETTVNTSLTPSTTYNPDAFEPTYNNAHTEPSETQSNDSLNNMARDINRMTALNEMTRNQLDAMQSMNENMNRLVRISEQMNQTSKQAANKRQSPVFRDSQTDALTEG